MSKTFNQTVKLLKRTDWEIRRAMWNMNVISNPYGAQRRKNMLRVLASEDMPVNCKYCIQVKNDPDLKRLIKEGLVKIVRRPWNSCISKPTTNKQYAVLVK